MRFLSSSPRTSPDQRRVLRRGVHRTGMKVGGAQHSLVAPLVPHSRLRANELPQ